MIEFLACAALIIFLEWKEHRSCIDLEERLSVHKDVFEQDGRTFHFNKPHLGFRVSCVWGIYVVKVRTSAGEHNKFIKFKAKDVVNSFEALLKDFWKRRIS